MHVKAWCLAHRKSSVNASSPFSSTGARSLQWYVSAPPAPHWAWPAHYLTRCLGNERWASSWLIRSVPHLFGSQGQTFTHFFQPHPRVPGWPLRRDRSLDIEGKGRVHLSLEIARICETRKNSKSYLPWTQHITVYQTFARLQTHWITTTKAWGTQFYYHFTEEEPEAWRGDITPLCPHTTWMPKSELEHLFSSPGKFYSSFKPWAASCPSKTFLDPTHPHPPLCVIHLTCSIIFICWSFCFCH